MFYNVASLLQEHTGATRAYDLDEEIDNEGERHRVLGRVRLDRTPRGVLVRANLQGTHETLCSRCLQAVTVPLDIGIAEVFIPMHDLVTGARVETLEGEEEAYRINDRNELDLREAIQQFWAMAVPMAPLCRDDCPGLCAECGKAIEAGHACGEQPIDERWSKLASLAETEGS